MSETGTKRELKQVKSGDGKSKEENGEPNPSVDSSDDASQNKDPSHGEEKPESKTNKKISETSSNSLIKVKYNGSSGQDLLVKKNIRIAMMNGGIYEVDPSLSLVEAMLANKSFEKVEDSIPLSSVKISEVVGKNSEVLDD